MWGSWCRDGGCDQAMWSNQECVNKAQETVLCEKLCDGRSKRWPPGDSQGVIWHVLQEAVNLPERDVPLRCCVRRYRESADVILLQ